MIKNAVISLLITWIFFREFAEIIPSPLLVVPAFYLVCLAAVVGIEDIIRKEWFY